MHDAITVGEFRHKTATVHEHDLVDPSAARRLFEATRPEVVFHLAAEVGGIGANRVQPGRFWYANLAMGMNVLEESRRVGVKKLVLVGTVCAYPKMTRLPFRETDLWFGYPDEVVTHAEAAAEWLYDALGDGTEPFATAFKKWLALVT